MDSRLARKAESAAVFEKAQAAYCPSCTLQASLKPVFESPHGLSGDWPFRPKNTCPNAMAHHGALHPLVVIVVPLEMRFAHVLTVAAVRGVLCPSLGPVPLFVQSKHASSTPSLLASQPKHATRSCRYRRCHIERRYLKAGRQSRRWRSPEPPLRSPELRLTRT